MFTNINITDEVDQYKYIIEYNPNANYTEPSTTYINTEDGVVFIDNDTTYNRVYNHWYELEHGSGITEFMPEICKSGVIKLYFPSFSIDTYETGHKYAITLGTWICGKYIALGNYIVSRHEALACPCKTFFNEQYYECIKLTILDPMSLIYSDDWKKWRQNVCGESLDPDSINSVGSNLYCALHPVVEVGEGEYMKMDGYVGGQSSIGLTESKTDFLSLDLTTNVISPMKNNEKPKFDLTLNFNKYYSGSLKEYLLETYGVKDCKIKYELIISDGDDIYSMCQSPELDMVTSYSFSKYDLNGFENGLGWKPGIKAVGSIEIVNNEDSIVYIISNEIPLTENIFRFFIKTEFYDKFNYDINNVNLDMVNMNILNINVVNKTENKIIKVDRPGDNKANIYQTTFYRVSEPSSIVIHPSVNENICINLDQYKHLVERFILQLEGMKFIEIGRLKSGIVFNVIGSRLPKKISSGQYYILNQDSELITSGKYIYEA